MSFNPFCIYKIRHHLTPEARKLLIQAHVFLHILYCLRVWGGAAACRLSRVQRVLNFAARVVSGARRGDHASPLLRALGWHSVTNLVTRRDCEGIFRALHDSRAPVAIRSLCVPRSRVSERTTRSSVTRLSPVNVTKSIFVSSGRRLEQLAVDRLRLSRQDRFYLSPGQIRVLGAISYSVFHSYSIVFSVTCFYSYLL